MMIGGGNMVQPGGSLLQPPISAAGARRRAARRMRRAYPAGRTRVKAITELPARWARTGKMSSRERRLFHLASDRQDDVGIVLGACPAIVDDVGAGEPQPFTRIEANAREWIVRTRLEETGGEIRRRERPGVGFAFARQKTAQHPSGAA